MRKVSYETPYKPPSKLLGYSHKIIPNVAVNLCYFNLLCSVVLDGTGGNYVVGDGSIGIKVVGNKLIII